MTRNLDGAQKTPCRLLPQHGTDGLLARCIGPVMADSRHDLQRLRPMTKDRAAQFKMRALAQRHVQRHAAQLPTPVEDVEIQQSEAPRVGKECGSTCSSRCSLTH